MVITNSCKSKSIKVKIIDETDLGLSTVDENNVEVIIDHVAMLKRGFISKEWVEKYPWKKIKKFFKILYKNLNS